MGTNNNGKTWGEWWEETTSLTVYKKVNLWYQRTENYKEEGYKKLDRLPPEIAYLLIKKIMFKDDKTINSERKHLDFSKLILAYYSSGNVPSIVFRNYEMVDFCSDIDNQQGSDILAKVLMGVGRSEDIWVGCMHKLICISVKKYMSKLKEPENAAEDYPKILPYMLYYRRVLEDIFDVSKVLQRCQDLGDEVDWYYGILYASLKGVLEKIVIDKKECEAFIIKKRGGWHLSSQVPEVKRKEHEKRYLSLCYVFLVKIVLKLCVYVDVTIKDLQDICKEEECEYLLFKSEFVLGLIKNADVRIAAKGPYSLFLDVFTEQATKQDGADCINYIEAFECAYVNKQWVLCQKIARGIAIHIDSKYNNETDLIRYVYILDELNRKLEKHVKQYGVVDKGLKEASAAILTILTAVQPKLSTIASDALRAINDSRVFFQKHGDGQMSHVSGVSGVSGVSSVSSLVQKCEDSIIRKQQSGSRSFC